MLPGIQVGVWAVTTECSGDVLVEALKSNTPHLLLVMLAPVAEMIRAGLRETFKSAASSGG